MDLPDPAPRPDRPRSPSGGGTPPWELARRRVQVLGGIHERWPAFDTALTRALLLRVASGDVPESMRIIQPRATVAFGRQDRLRAPFPTASLAARSAGFAVTERLAGAQTFAYHEGCLYLAHAVPDPRPERRIQDRYVEMSSIIASTLRTLGVDARVGELPLEPDPGAYSVNARGAAKLASISYHPVAGAALIIAVLVVSEAERLRDVLVDVYEALRFDWDPARLGSVEDELGEITVAQVGDALVDEISSRHDVVEGEFDAATRTLAEAMEPEHTELGIRMSTSELPDAQPGLLPGEWRARP